MKKIMSNDSRERLVQSYGKIKKANEVATAFDVSESTVFRLVRQYKETGTVELQTHKRGRKPILTPEQLQKVKETILETPDITMQEIIDKLQLPIKENTLCVIVKYKLGFTRKKKMLFASESDRLRRAGNERNLARSGAQIGCKQNSLHR